MRKSLLPVQGMSGLRPELVGQPTEDSDVDLLVIMDHDKARNVEQALSIRLQADTPFPMDLLVRRPAEVAERVAMNDTFIRNILDEGEVLYG